MASRFADSKALGEYKNCRSGEINATTFTVPLTKGQSELRKPESVLGRWNQLTVRHCGNGLHSAISTVIPHPLHAAAFI